MSSHESLYLAGHMKWKVFTCNYNVRTSRATPLDFSDIMGYQSTSVAEDLTSRTVIKSIYHEQIAVVGQLNVFSIMLSMYSWTSLMQQVGPRMRWRGAQPPLPSSRPQVKVVFQAIWLRCAASLCSEVSLVSAFSCSHKHRSYSLHSQLQNTTRISRKGA